MKNFLLKLIFGIALIPLVFNSCQKDPLLETDPVNDIPLKNGVILCKTIEKSLIAGQTILVGTVTVSNDETNLFVTFETTDDWYMTGAKLWVGEDINDIPATKKGNPKIGHFPYKEDLVDATSFTFQIPFSEIGDVFEFANGIKIAAHADAEKVKVVNNKHITVQETVWGCDCSELELLGTRWGWVMSYFPAHCL